MMAKVKDKSLLGSALFITIIVNVVIMVCMILADSVSVVAAEIVVGETQSIQEHLNTTIFFNKWVIWLVSVPILYLIAFIFLNYLDNGCENGIFKLPYKEKYDKKSRTFREGLFHY